MHLQYTIDTLLYIFKLANAALSIVSFNNSTLKIHFSVSFSAVIGSLQFIYNIRQNSKKKKLMLKKGCILYPWFHFDFEDFLVLLYPKITWTYKISVYKRISHFITVWNRFLELSFLDSNFCLIQSKKISITYSKDYYSEKLVTKICSSRQQCVKCICTINTIN